jgi:hypothetical protein
MGILLYPLPRYTKRPRSLEGAEDVAKQDLAVMPHFLRNTRRNRSERNGLFSMLPNRSACEPMSHNTAAALAHNNHQIIQDSCPSCLYTGVATCFGLAGYFTYIAVEDELKAGTTSVRALRQAARQRPWLLAISAGWIAIGIHRWNLG